MYKKEDRPHNMVLVLGKDSVFEFNHHDSENILKDAKEVVIKKEDIKHGRFLDNKS